MPLCSESIVEAAYQIRISKAGGDAHAPELDCLYRSLNPLGQTVQILHQTVATEIPCYSHFNYFQMLVGSTSNCTCALHKFFIEISSSVHIHSKRQYLALSFHEQLKKRMLYLMCVCGFKIEPQLIAV